VQNAEWRHSENSTMWKTEIVEEGEWIARDDKTGTQDYDKQERLQADVGDPISIMLQAAAPQGQSRARRNFYDADLQ